MDIAVLYVVLEAVFFKHYRRTRMLVAVLAVAGRVQFLVPIVSVAVPPTERFIEFSKNSMTGLCVEVRVAFVALEVGFECRAVGDPVAGVVNAPCCVPGVVSGLASREPKLIETVTHLPLVACRSTMGANDGSIRHAWPVL